VAVNHAAQALAEQGMIIHDQDAAFFRRRFPHTRLGRGLFHAAGFFPLAARAAAARQFARSRQKKTGEVVPEPGWLCKFKVAPMSLVILAEDRETP
jgi:hypothetical protein